MVGRIRSSKPERGAAMVELSLVGLLLAMILMGLIEMGLAWHASTTIERATRLGARAGSGLTLDDRADRETLRALTSALTTAEAGLIEYVVIYDATATSEPPVPCQTGSNAGLRCNHYEPADLNRLDDDTAWGCTGAALDRAWCPGDRDSITVAPTLIGVHVKSQRDWITGFFPGDGLDFTSETVMSLIPLDQ